MGRKERACEYPKNVGKINRKIERGAGAQLLLFHRINEKIVELFNTKCYNQQ